MPLLWYGCWAAKDDSFDADDALDLDCEARRVFNKFDLNGSGTLDFQELHLALMMNGKFMTPFDPRQAFGIFYTFPSRV